MKHTYVEFTCDYCGQAEHYLVSVYGTHGLSPDQQAKKMGWVIRNKKHFCCENCYDNYKRLKEIQRKYKSET